MNQVLILSGAGLSAESGIPTFRDPGGLWLKNDPAKFATIATLENHRDEVFHFYNLRRSELKERMPNPAHIALANLQKKWGKNRVVHFTQNGDDLMEKAGALEIHHVHGKMTDMGCQACNRTWYVGYQPQDRTARCPYCNSVRTKPGVVFFGEDAPMYAEMDRIFKASRRDMVLVVGTQGTVIPFKRTAGNRFHPSRSITILNNLHREYGVNYRKFFDQTAFEPASVAIPRIAERLDGFLTDTAAARA